MTELSAIDVEFERCGKKVDPLLSALSSAVGVTSFATPTVAKERRDSSTHVQCPRIGEERNAHMREKALSALQSARQQMSHVLQLCRPHEKTLSYRSETLSKNMDARAPNCTQKPEGVNRANPNGGLDN